MSEPTIRRLRRVAALLLRGDEDQRWVGNAIIEAIEDGGSLDESLGIRSAQRLGARNALIWEVHQRHFSDADPYAATTKISRLAKEVAKLAKLGRLDQIDLDDPRHLIADAMNIGLRFPKERQLFNVLSLQSAPANCTVALQRSQRA